MARSPRLARWLGAVLLVSSAMIPMQMQAQERGQARSMVISRYGIVAAESPLAAQAGADILARGGNAVDAAIAANAMMGVIAPMSNGIGGDLFAMVYDAKTGKLYGLNGSGWAPKGMNIELLTGKGLRAMPVTGIFSVTIPGAVDGWQKLSERFGRKKLNELLAPAIRTAEEGFPVGEMVSMLWPTTVDLLRANDAAAKTYLISDRAPRLGEVFRNPDLAWSLRQIADHGRDAYYKGEIAKRIVELSRKHGGVMTPDDFAGYSGEWVEPLSTTYRDWTVYEMPPNGQGIGALIMLNIMENFPLAQFGANSTKALHVMIEAKKLAYADVLRYVGDPHASKLPVEGLLAKAYAKERAAKINMDKANCDVAPGEPNLPGGDTIYLSVADRDGNMVSLIQSNYENFGSGLVAPGTGFALQDRGALFSLDPSSPNALAGHKRPLHTIIPAMMQKGDLRIAFGIMGGWNQAQAHAQFVANVVDFKMNIQAALENPRFSKHSFSGCDVPMENRFPANVRKELQDKGHEIDLRGAFSAFMGGGQSVMRDFAAGVNFGASDPRKDGAAIPELPREK
jgi:gamma-glutamyltranspeptidase/glutathione hydrolase